MAENVPTTALEGLGNALQLIGERSAPPGIELALPSQPVHDLTTYVRYGSAHRFGKFNDGWVTFSLVDTVSTAIFAATTVADWSAHVSGAFGISAGKLSRMALWVYGVTLQAGAATALADIGAATLRLGVPAGMTFQGTYEEQLLFAAEGQNEADVVQTAALEVQMINRVKPAWPVQWAAGQGGQFIQENLNANVVTYAWALTCRMLPMGQAPLP